MYGTVARFQIKPGMEGKLHDLMKSYEQLNMPGYKSTTVYKLDAGDNQYMMSVVFADKNSYMKNADSPDQDRRYQEMRAILTDDPDWMDGEIIYHA
jgi:antibiotic biosynthesis monooxygenase (ABM) superfamily enzyme